MNRDQHTHSIANDHHRAALIHMAAQKGVEQARGDFHFALMSEGLDDETIALFAHDAWEALTRRMVFDYPQFAQKLYLHAYRSAYRAHLNALASAEYHTTAELVAAIEAEIGLTPPAGATPSAGE
jgi:aminopeptidase N